MEELRILTVLHQVDPHLLLTVVRQALLDYLLVTTALLVDHQLLILTVDHQVVGVLDPQLLMATTVPQVPLDHQLLILTVPLVHQEWVDIYLTIWKLFYFLIN